ncbi:class I SAM-dependent DNA methyltransferase [Chryseobacterium sp. 8AT]|uniref:class I SAM-dependent DNA methyltransferase n=1 Tax=Chryseobacterium sp. 8AT TaxID=2653134 RepID=UPI0012EF3050|nr:DNA methyltransferase [Chryseobacterium sp. 8AT]VXC56435.1 putative DNA methyltransferase YeeA [Chryseobacterium sp. 8AT]
MKKTDIQDKLKSLAQHIDQEQFIYDFLLAFGFSKTTITRLKKGDYNLSKKEGELFYKGKIFFKVTTEDQLLHTIDELSKDEKIAKQKPRFIFVTDFEKGVAIDTRKKLNKEFELTALGELEQVDFFLPLSGAEIYRVENNNKADRDAAYKLGELYDLLVADNPDWVEKGTHQLNLFLSRLLFCFFAEDTGIFDTKNVFTEALVNNTKADGSDLDHFLDILFLKLDSKPNTIDFPDYLKGFPYVNGGLFRDKIDCPKFSKKARQILIDTGELEWADINPDIFGSMIQAVADPEERNNLGMHYTSVVNIKKLIKPLFLDELYEEFEKNKDNARALDKLLVRMSKIKFFDPACGSGNFLIITYKELRNLEIEIIKQLIDLNSGVAEERQSVQSKIGFDANAAKTIVPDVQSKMNFSGTQSKIYFTEISLTQFYGIEIKDFAHEMAILSLWLTEHQMNQIFETELLDNGRSKPILPLKEAGNIVSGNAARTNWEDVCPKNEGDEIYIIGNPPYYGARKQDTEQKKDISINFSNQKGANNLDYIFIWIYKGVKYIEGINAKLGLVSTNSICQGEQVSLLWPKILNDKIEIDFAYQSFKWTNNAKGNAGVTVVIIGLRNISSAPKYLFKEVVVKEVKNINAYLIDFPNTFIVPRTKSISKLPEMSFGNMPNDGGNLILNQEEFEKIKSDVPSSDSFLKKFIGAEEFLNGKTRYCLWFSKENYLDFIKYPIIKERLDKVYKHRSESRREATNKLKNSFYAFGEVRFKETDSILVPRHSSETRDYIPLDFYNSDTVIADSAMAIYDAEPWLFGVLHSKMHMVWVDAVGGKLKTDYRYSAKLCYNTFPFPLLTAKQKESITQYVFAVLDERAKFPEKTMAWMYNPETMPAGLKKAHHELDLAIERVYRLAAFNSDEERLAYLFKMYEEMTNRETLFAKEKKTRKKKA